MNREVHGRMVIQGFGSEESSIIGRNSKNEGKGNPGAKSHGLIPRAVALHQKQSKTAQNPGMKKPTATNMEGGSSPFLTDLPDRSLPVPRLETHREDSSSRQLALVASDYGNHESLPEFKKPRIGKQVQDLLETCRSIEGLDSPKNHKAIAKASNSGTGTRLGRNTAMALLTRSRCSFDIVQEPHEDLRSSRGHEAAERQ